jgi:sugar lactone lactonase YvrE
MKKQIRNGIFGFTARKRFVVGAAALMLLATGAHAQFVSTVISSNLFEPNSVATDASGNAYITDSSDNTIVAFVPGTGSVSTLAGSPGHSGYSSGPSVFAQFTQPMGIVVARGGLVVVDQGNQVIRFLTTNGVVSPVPLAGVPGVAGTNNGPGATATFNFPSGIAADSAGNLYVADQGNNMIRKIDTNNVVTTIVPVNGYKFLQPTGVAIDNDGNILVSDTGNQVICLITNGTVNVVAGTSGTSGYSENLLSLPTGLLWVGASSTLLIADTGNNVIRSLYLTNYFGETIYFLQTVAGIPGAAGIIDGAPGAAEFTAPVGLAVDPFDSGYYVVDRYGANQGGPGVTGTGSLRVFQSVKPLPRPNPPVLGFVTFSSPSPGTPPVTTFNASAAATFNNTAIIAIEPGSNAQAFITYGPTGATNIPQPGPNSGASPSSYEGDGQTTAAPSIVQPEPDLTIYAVSVGATGEESTVASARYQWVTANPIVSGLNAANLTVSDDTAGASIYYTTDGSVPNLGNLDTFGPIDGTNFSIVITSNTVLTVRAFTNNYQPSGIATLDLSFSNYVANTVSFATNSSRAGSGATLAIPIYATMANSAGVLKSIQFRAEVAPAGGNGSIVGQLNDVSFSPTDYLPLPGVTAEEAIFEYYQYATNSAEGLLVATYTNSGLNVTGFGTVGLVEIPIPDTVVYGQTYTLSVINPSGTSDGDQASVALAGYTNLLTITDPIYLAGDSSPAGGYNAGEFGDGQLNNADVNNAMYASVGIRSPIVFTDAHDDMDVWPVDNGDGQITLLDWETILNRAVGLDTNNWIRFRTNGGTLMHQQVAWTPGGTPIALADAEPRISRSKNSDGPTPPGLVWLRQASISGGTLANVTPGSVCSIPVYANVSSGASLSALQFRAILSAEGSAPTPGSIAFSPASGIPAPITLPGLSANDIACFWAIGGFPAGLKGNSYLGTISFQVPSDAKTGSSYAVHFSGVGGAPNMQSEYQLESFPGRVWVNSTPLQPPQISSDEWRIAFFGSVDNSLAADNVDADGDGMLNWQEYLAGTNPTNSLSKLQFSTTSLNPNNGQGVAMTWLTAPGKTYTLQSSPTITGPNWTTVNTNVGDGNNYQFIQPNQSGAALFYQLRVNQ